VTLTGAIDMSLQDRLDQISRASSDDVSPAMKAVMTRAVEDLRRSGAKEQVIKLAAIAPEFELLDQDGRLVKLADLRAQGPVVVSFYRWVWCPYCNEDLKTLQDILSGIRDAGASLVALSPQTSANSRRAIRDLNFEYPLLWGKGAAAADLFGLRFKFPDDLRAVYTALGVDLARINGEDSWTLPMPARLVIERDGTISYVESDPDYTRRPEPAEIIAHLARRAAAV
jgi:peroxiredoxin